MLEGRTILVADDNKLNQKILIFVLHKSGAVIDVANNGAEAVQLVKEKKYDAVLMDVQMPEMDGIEAAQIIKGQLRQAVPIIGLTASTLPTELAKCIAAGMVSCISKPFDPKDLIDLVVSVIQ